MNSAPRTASILAAAVCVALLTSCKDEQSAEAAGSAEASSPDDTDCEVTTVWVGWNEPEAASIARIHAVAEALTATSIAR